MIDCVFCDIIKGEYPSRIVYEDADVLAFEDINPKAPIHILISPKRHLATLFEAGEDERALLGNLLLAANRIADQCGVGKRGFRLVLNCNPEGGQVVYHLHMHLLAGRQMAWSPA